MSGVWALRFTTHGHPDYSLANLLKTKRMDGFEMVEQSGKQHVAQPTKRAIEAQRV